MKDRGGLVKILLYLGDLISLRRILVLLQIRFDGRELDGLGHRDSLPGISHGRDEFVEELSEENEGDTGGIFEICDDRTGQTIGADVAVDDVLLVGYGLALSGGRAFGERLREEGKHLLHALIGQSRDVFAWGCVECRVVGIIVRWPGGWRFGGEGRWVEIRRFALVDDEGVKGAREERGGAESVARDFEGRAVTPATTTVTTVVERGGTRRATLRESEGERDRYRVQRRRKDTSHQRKK